MHRTLDRALFAVAVVAVLCAHALPACAQGSRAEAFAHLPPPPLPPRGVPAVWNAFTPYPFTRTTECRDVDEDASTNTRASGPRPTGPAMLPRRHSVDISPCLSHAEKKRRLLHFHAQIVPVLYVHADDALTLPLNIEHIVPVSVLKASPNPEAVADYSNCFLALRDVNIRRQNYRIAFDLEQRSVHALCNESKSAGVKHLGYGNCVDDARCLFYPRRADVGLVARVILNMQRKWAFPLDTVTMATVDELVRISTSTPPSIAETTQRLLLASVDHGLLK